LGEGEGCIQEEERDSVGRRRERHRWEKERDTVRIRRGIDLGGRERHSKEKERETPSGEG